MSCTRILIRQVNAHVTLNILTNVVTSQENIVIGPNGQAMICDFGCAHVEMTSQSIAAPSPSMKGTYNYWAPELLILGGMTTSEQSDVWAFGMTIYVRKFNLMHAHSDLIYLASR